MIQREIAPQDLYNAVRRRWLLILLLAIFGAGIGFGASRILPKRYTSQTLVLVQQPTVSTDLVTPIFSDEASSRLAAMQQQILSRSSLEPLIHQLGLYPQDASRVPMDDLVQRLRKAISITSIRPMPETRAQHLPGFYISVEFNNPHLAQQICSRLTSLFMEENLQTRQALSEQTTDFLASQLADAKAKLDAQDSKLADFQRRYLGSLPDDEQMNLNILGELSSQLGSVTQTIDRTQQNKSFAESQLAQQLSIWQASQSGQSAQTLEQQLTARQKQLVTMRLQYTDDYPDVIRLKNDIATLKKEIAKEHPDKKPNATGETSQSLIEPPQIQQLRNEIHGYDLTIQNQSKREQELQKEIKTYQARVQSSPAIEQEYKELTRDYQTALGFYNDLLKKRDQSAMATDLERRQQGETFQVLDPANLPDKPSFPKMPLFAGGGFGGGLALGVGLTLLLELQDTSLKSEHDVEISLRLPVLAIIPVIPQGHNKGKSQAGTPGFPRVRAG